MKSAGDKKSQDNSWKKRPAKPAEQTQKNKKDCVEKFWCSWTIHFIGSSNMINKYYSRKVSCRFINIKILKDIAGQINYKKERQYSQSLFNRRSLKSKKVIKLWRMQISKN